MINERKKKEGLHYIERERERERDSCLGKEEVKIDTNWKEKGRNKNREIIFAHVAFKLRRGKK